MSRKTEDQKNLEAEERIACILGNMYVIRDERNRFKNAMKVYNSFNSRRKLVSKRLKNNPVAKVLTQGQFRAKVVKLKTRYNRKANKKDSYDENS